MTSGRAQEPHLRELARLHRLLAPPVVDPGFRTTTPRRDHYGFRHCAFRDPAGNLVRIQERR